MIERREFRRHLCGGIWWADRSVCGFCFLRPFEPSANVRKSLADLLEEYPEPRGALPEILYAPPRCEPGVVHYNCEHARARFIYGHRWRGPGERIPLSVRFRWQVRAVCRQIRALFP